MRLVEGESEWEGRLEVCFNRRWGTVSSDGWTQTNTQVICNDLGYQSAGMWSGYTLHFLLNNVVQSHWPSSHGGTTDIYTMHIYTVDREFFTGKKFHVKIIRWEKISSFSYPRNIFNTNAKLLWLYGDIPWSLQAGQRLIYWVSGSVYSLLRRLQGVSGAVALLAITESYDRELCAVTTRTAVFGPQLWENACNYKRTCQ